MEAFVWDDRYITGEDQIDGEHQELIRIINTVIDLHSKYASPSQINSVLDQLIRYAVVHFGHEEKLMAEEGCDPRFIAMHVGVHREFAGQVVRLRQSSGDTVDTEHLVGFLTSWLVCHILGVDKSMGRQLAKIRTGIPADTAYLEETQLVSDPATSSMLDAMNSLYRIIAARNDALQQLNATLEAKVDARTQALTESNLQVRLAMQQLEITQKKLLESEHRRAEAARRNLQLYLSQIIEGDPVPTLVIDAEHRITHWNQACALISGLPAQDMVGTRDQWKAFYPSARPIMADLIVNGSLEEQFEAHYKGIFHRSKVIPDAFEGENYFPSLGNHGRWLFFTAAPLRDSAGQLIGAIETLQDVTERHLAEDELRRYQGQLEALVSQRTQQLEAANAHLAREQKELTQLLSKVDEAQNQLLQSEKMAAIGQLAAGVAHEINNPVGFVNSNIGTLKTYITQLFAVLDAYEAVGAGGDPAQLAEAKRQADLDFLREDLPELIKESQDGLGRVTRIVQDLKDFSHVDESSQQEADLNAGIESTLNVVWNEIKYKAEICRQLGTLPPVHCIPAQINQVFMNILVNAAQAIDGHGTITLRSGTVNDYAWVEIEDTGKGMPEEVRKRIFEPFYTTKPVGKGTGLGLSISYDIIVKKHGGSLDVTSTPGKGTCFRIMLPIAGRNSQAE